LLQGPLDTITSRKISDDFHVVIDMHTVDQTTIYVEGYLEFFLWRFPFRFIDVCHWGKYNIVF